jgi:hypothetical protein
MEVCHKIQDSKYQTQEFLLKAFNLMSQLSLPIDEIHFLLFFFQLSHFTTYF